MDLIVPAPIEAVIAKFDQATEPFNEHDVKQALLSAREALGKLEEAENLGAWAEVLAFALTEHRHGPSPWKTHFGPFGSFTQENGERQYSPDIAGTDAEVVAHWARRAASCAHPVLKARYADLCWDMARAIADTNPDPDMARLAIDCYLASVAAGALRSIHDEFEAAIRALDLAEMLRDIGRVDAARSMLLQVHARSVARGKGLWWKAFDRLIDDRNARLTEQERDQLVADFEGLASRFATTSDPSLLDPNGLETVAERLIPFYTRSKRRADVVRLRELVGRSFEHAAGLADPMLASSFLQTAVTSYRAAGLAADGRRARVAMEEKIEASRTQMQSFTFESTISREDMEQFLVMLVTDNIGETFVRIAAEFLPRREALEEQVKRTAEESPLSAMIPQSVMAERHVAASVGSVADDPFGRLIRHSTQSMAFSDVWLSAAFGRAIEVHELTPHHFVTWAMRTSLFDGATLVAEGVRAWFAGDFVKAIHVLVPQIEVALRRLAENLGLPTTKAHPRLQGVGVAVNLGDLLFTPEVAEALGADITLYLQTVYSDPRGRNLRNDMAHGLMSVDEMDEHAANKIIHTLLILGIWDQLAASRNSSPSGDAGSSA